MSGASPEAIAFHYDVGTDFYRLWLDPTLTYSAAMWDASSAGDLSAAQRRKLRYAVAESGADSARRVLDVGCGWGSLLAAAVNSGAEHAFGLTLSSAQAEHVRALGDARIGVAYTSYREYTPDAPYDALCCIGAIEHFSRPEHNDAERLAVYRDFFAWCHRALAPGARMYLQFFGYGAAERERAPSFLHEVFPESEMPRLWEICQALDRWFEVRCVRNDREDYVRTLNAWRENLRRNRDAATMAVSPEIVAHYMKFLGVAAIGLHVGATGLYRLSLRRLDRA